MSSPASNGKAPLTPQPLIAGAYFRVSTAGQENEATIESQIDEVVARIKADGNILLPENKFEDNGWSGTLLQRPGLDAMRDAVATDKFQVLYVYDRGRLARKYFYQEIVLEELENRNIKFVSLKDKTIESEDDRVVQGMQGLFAEWERTKISERFRRGKMFKAKTGVLINGHALYGYHIIRKPDQPLRYEIYEPEAHIVRMIYNWFVIKKMSQRKIIEKLYKLGIMPPKHKQDHWVKESVLRILKCETYSKGFVYFNKHEAVVAKNPTSPTKYKKVKKTSRKVRPKEEWLPYPVPTIITDDGTYEKALEMLKHNQKFAKKNRKHPYLLTGKIECGCGFIRTGDGRQIGQTYYRCVQRTYKHPEPSECTYPGVNSKAFDEALWNGLVEAMRKPKTLHEKATLHLKALTAQTENHQEETHLQTLTSKEMDMRQRYAIGFGSGDMELATYQNLVRESKKREAGYQTQLKGMQESKQPSAQGKDELWPLCIEASRIFRSKDLINKEAVISDVIDKVIVWRHEFDIHAHIEIPSPSLPLNVGLYAKSRDRLSTTPTFQLLPFVLISPLPKPRRERIIAQRDKLGRIVHSHAPVLDLISN